jgi:ketosteroid isomerase-like protein
LLRVCKAQIIRRHEGLPRIRGSRVGDGIGIRDRRGPLKRYPALPDAASVVALVGIALLFAGCASTPHQDTAVSANVVAELSAQADRWDKAIVRKDRAAIVANMAEDFRHIDGAGNLESKASFVDGLMSPDLQIDPYTVEDFNVRLYADVALLSGRTRMTGKFQGKPFASHYRYIDIYVRRDGAWKIVSVQISRIPDA